MPGTKPTSNSNELRRRVAVGIKIDKTKKLLIDPGKFFKYFFQCIAPGSMGRVRDRRL